jgi:predicted DNA-binding protein
VTQTTVADARLPEVHCLHQSMRAIFVIPYYGENTVAVSVRLDPVLENKLTQQAALLGVTKSDFIKDALERVLGMKNPATLLNQVRRGGAMGRPDASAKVSSTVKNKLRAKRTD